jgi:Family of unknown function (DUF6600)/FecR protein
MKSNRSPRGYWLFVLLAAALIASTLNLSPAKAQSNSQVRIVRLSFVEGTVTVYRPDADQWATAFVNTPIQQGFKVATDTKSFAEVEFENGSTVRLGQLSELDFPSLSLSPEGGKINHLTLAQGYASFAFSPERGDVYKVLAAGSTFDAADKTMFRLDLNQGGQRLEVFNGNVSVQGPDGSGNIARNQVLELTPDGAKPFQVTEGITEDAWDQWVQKRQQTATVASNKAGPGNGSLSAGSSLYGWNDLSYFGAWNYLPGYGSCWSPMMGSGWAPYSIGRWSYYPGLGYTWISGLPWGWLPFHYGSWIYPAGLGWCWMPGNFSVWSPALVTWQQAPGWVSWAPRTFAGRYNCPAGQNCSVAVSSNTFQGGRAISPGDVIRLRPFQGHAVDSPTLPLTRNLRLPGPASNGPRFISGTGTGVRSDLRVNRIVTAPSRVFSQSSIRGAWDVQPHTPAVFDSQTRRFVNRTGPAINNDMLLRSRRGFQPGNSSRQLSSIPISDLGVHGGAMRHSSSLVPSAQPAGNAAAFRTFRPQQMPDLRQERRMLRREQRIENERARRQMEQMNQRSRMSQQHMDRSSSRRSSGGLGRNQSMGQSSSQMGSGTRNSGTGGGMRNSGTGGGMRSGGSGGTGGGMQGGGGGGGPHGGPHH